MRRYKKSKYENDAIIITSTVTEIEQKNVEVSDKIKNVFYLKSNVFPERGRLCILWGYSNAKVGDTIRAKGRITPDGTFLAWSTQIVQKGNADAL
jgi:hypothetical protein